MRDGGGVQLLPWESDSAATGKDTAIGVEDASCEGDVGDEGGILNIFA